MSNGDATKEQPKSKIPDLRTMLEALSGNKVREDRRGVLDAIIASDKNNPTKSRIPSAAGMAVFQMLGMWASTKKMLNYEVQGTMKQFPRTVEGSHDLFKRLYDEDAISLTGKSREEWVTGMLGYFLQDIEDIDRIKQNRVSEGDKKQ